MKVVCVFVDEFPCGCFECIFRKSTLKWVDIDGTIYYIHTCIILDIEIEDIDTMQEYCILKVDRRKSRYNDSKN